MVSIPNIKVWHVLFSGFRQDPGKPNGIGELWAKMHYSYASHDTVVLYKKWNDDVDELAELIWRRQPASKLWVNVIGYSWGFATAVELCKALQIRGIEVDNLIGCDGVYRDMTDWPLLGWVKQWRALVSSSEIVIPDNVDRFKGWRQQSDPLLRGHAVKRVGSDVDMTEIVDKGVTHTYMDDYKPFHWYCMDRAKVIQEKAA